MRGGPSRARRPGGGSAPLLTWLQPLLWFCGLCVLLFNTLHAFEPGGGSGSGRGGGAAKARKAGAAASAAPPRKRLAVIALCRDSDAGELAASVRSFDAAYSLSAHPRDVIVFSEAVWPAAARALVANATRAAVAFVQLSASEWATPPHINRSRFDAILSGSSYYGNTEAYRRMCRFFAGPVFLTEALRGYDFYWRMDSHVRYLCDVPAPDPLDRLDRAGAVYGYALRMTEHLHTVPTLWATVREFGAAQGLLGHVREAWGVDPERPMPRVCHYWNNLEVARLDFFRAPAYQALFRHLDAAGGFFYERWGDAPIRTFALMLLAKPAQVLQFEDVAYQHPWWFRCPATCGGRDKCVPDPDIQPHQATDGKICQIGE